MYRTLKWTLLTLLLSSTSASFAQTKSKSITDPSFVEFMAGVKYGHVAVDTDHEGDYYWRSATKGCRRFLGKHGIIPTYEGQPKSPCETVIMLFSYADMSSGLLGISERIERFTVRFISCNQEEWILTLPTTFTIPNSTKAVSKFYRTLRRAFRERNIKLLSYNADKEHVYTPRFKIWKEADFRAYLSNNTTDQVEGIYDDVSASGANYQLGIVREKGDLLRVFFLSADNLGVHNRGIWFPGDTKGLLSKTSSKLFYKILNYRKADKSLAKEAFVEFKEGQMIITVNGGEPTTYLKVFPLAE